MPDCKRDHRCRQQVSGKLRPGAGTKADKPSAITHFPDPSYGKVIAIGAHSHHYKVIEPCGIRWANLIVATGHNNLAIGGSVQQVRRALHRWQQATGRHANRVSVVVRAYDPCLSC
ncbi:MAG: hypothetical protein WB762_16060 [Candidatus Sulfotelmatobacter sp.]